MKTGVIMQSKDRNLFGITIRQNTKEEFLSLSDLQKAYDMARWQYGWKDKRIPDILSSKDTRERVYHLLKERDLIKTEISVFMEMVDREGLTNVLKGTGLYKTTGRGVNKTVMCDPYIWILIAMELNPLLYAKVLIWVADTLIFDRISAGSEYIPMNTEIKKIVPNPNYPEYAKHINIKVFGKHITGMRNLASAPELRRIADIEKQIIAAIDMGWIRTESDLLNFLKR